MSNPFSRNVQPASGSDFVLYRQVLDQAPCLVHLHDAVSTAVLYANPRFERVLGTAPDTRALLPRHITATLPRHSDPATPEVTYETLLKSPDGSVLRLQTRASVFATTPDGTPAQILCWSEVLADSVTERRLRLKEAMLRNAEHLRNFGNWLHDLTTGEVEWTQGLYRVYGYEDPATRPPHMTVELIMSRHTRPDERVMLEARAAEFIAQKRDYETEWTLVRLDGQERQVTERVHLVFNEQGEVTCMLGSTADVTEEREAQNRLSENEKLLSESETTFGYGSWRVDEIAGTVRWSLGLYRIFDMEAAEPPLTFEQYMDSIVAEDREYVKSVRDTALCADRDYSYETTIVTAAGNAKSISVKGRFTCDEQDRLVSSVGSVTDITARKNAENERVRQASLLQSIIDNSQAGIFRLRPLYDATGRLVEFVFTHVNQTVAALANTTPEHLIGIPGGQLFATYLTNGLFARYRDIYEKGGSERFEFQYVGDGLDVWFDIMANRHSDELLVNFMDVTELKNAQLAQQQQADFLQTLIDHMDTALVLYETVRDASGQAVDFRHRLTNPAHLRTIGRTAEEFYGQTMTEIFPGTREHGFFDQLTTVLDTGQPQSFILHYDRDGLDVWADARLSPQNGGVLFTYTDITAVKRMQLAQERQSQLLQSILDHIPTGIVLYRAMRGEDGTIVDFVHELSNPVNAAVTGIAETELVGKTMREIFPDNWQNGTFELLAKAMESEQSVRIEHEYRSHGVSGWFDSSFIRQGDGVLFTFTDITALKTHQKNLERTNAELSRSNAELERFAYVASHDLSEPLRKIQLFAKLLDKNLTDNISLDGRQYLERMVAAARRMQQLIDSLLAFSRIGRLELPFVPTDLNEVVRHVLTTLEDKIHEQNATIDVEPLPTLPAEPSQMNQLFTNLLTNALKFGKHGVPPVVRIAAGPATADEVAQSRLDQHRSYVRITVTDNGIGFEEEYRERIFTVFQRLHSVHEYPGSGVGLAICRKIAENHGGAIYADSQLGEGAVFTVLLPEK
ncbi:MAG: PAS domain-containing protein [Cytophagales bacterium]|nr:PAS domain-containing protein [Cytophagales bacterium]